MVFVDGRDSRQAEERYSGDPLATGVDKLTLSTFSTVSAANRLAFRLCSRGFLSLARDRLVLDGCRGTPSVAVPAVVRCCMAGLIRGPSEAELLSCRRA
jgi:hypothetical protein